MDVDHSVAAVMIFIDDNKIKIIDPATSSSHVYMNDLKVMEILIIKYGST